MPATELTEERNVKAARRINQGAASISVTTDPATTEKIDVSALAGLSIRKVSGSVASVTVLGGRAGGTHAIVDGCGTAGVVAISTSWVDLGAAVFNMAELSFDGDATGVIEVCGTS